MSELTAYEKMLQDGTAFKKINMDNIQKQIYAEARTSASANGKDIGVPLGDPTNNNPVKENNNLEYDDTDFSAIDEAMQRRMNSLRSKIHGKKATNENIEIAKLEKRVKRLEEALMVIMEAHEKLL
jgi:hypothetical protein